VRPDTSLEPHAVRIREALEAEAAVPFAGVRSRRPCTTILRESGRSFR